MNYKAYTDAKEERHYNEKPALQVGRWLDCTIEWLEGPARLVRADFMSGLCAQTACARTNSKEQVTVFYGIYLCL